MKIGFDFDGVLCPTPFGRLAVHAPSPVEDLPADFGALYDQKVSSNPIRLAVEYMRFAWRSPAENGRQILEQLAAHHELYLVTGRSRIGQPQMEKWLRARGWRDSFAGIWMSPAGLKAPQHKLAVAKMQGIGTHIDDDPRTAYHLARHGVQTYLLDHANAHGETPPPDNLTLVRSLSDFAAKMTP
jgi:FMN phosphatase YigB (HAD superfamily)